MSRFHSWLINSKDVITVVKDLVTIVALICGLISILVAAFQLKITAGNIKSQTVYQISHEGREVAKSITPNMPTEHIGQVISFIYSVWNQHRFGTYDESLWASFREEVCQFLKVQSNFPQYWRANQKLFSKEFVTFLEERSQQCA